MFDAVSPTAESRAGSTFIRAFAEAFEAVSAYKEFPYAIRRRRADAPSEERVRLSEELRKVQTRLTYYLAWTQAESEVVGDAYAELVTELRRLAGAACRDAWLTAPITEDARMNIGPDVVDLSALSDLEAATTTCPSRSSDAGSSSTSSTNVASPAATAARSWRSATCTHPASRPTHTCSRTKDPPRMPPIRSGRGTSRSPQPANGSDSSATAPPTTTDTPASAAPAWTVAAPSPAPSRRPRPWQRPRCASRS